MLFRAADVVVLPYRKVLNSGVLMLALTFGCQSVAPENPVTADLVGSGLVHLFDETSDDDLDRAIAEAIALRTERRVLPAVFLDRFDHVEVAGRFAHAQEPFRVQPQDLGHELSELAVAQYHDAVVLGD